MSKGRMEAFSDGVIAILITIMVLELTVPHEARHGRLHTTRLSPRPCAVSGSSGESSPQGTNALGSVPCLRSRVYQLKPR